VAHMRSLRAPWRRGGHIVAPPQQQDGHDGAARFPGGRPHAVVRGGGTATDPSLPPDDGAHEPAASAGHKMPGPECASLTPQLTFLWCFLNDRQRLEGFAYAVRVVTFAAVALLLGLSAFIYVVTLHEPVAARIAISSGSMVITIGGTLLGTAARARRRRGKDDR